MSKINKVKVTLKNVKIAFPNIFEAKGFNGSKPKFSCVLLVNKQDEQVKIAKQAIEDLIKTEWPDIAKRPKLKDKISFRDGDDEKYEGYPGNYFISASNMLQPKVLNAEGKPAEKDLIQGGDEVHAIIEFWAQNNQFGARVNANLVAVKFIKQGKRFFKKDDDLFDDSAETVAEEENPFE